MRERFPLAAPGAARSSAAGGSFLAAAALCAVALAVAGAADAAQVRQVRVGDHAGFTRIVLELDGPASYRLDQREVAGVAELVVEVDATTAGRVVTSRSRLVESVSLRPEAGGARARIQLRSGPVRVKEMVLKGPSRIVLDLSPTPPEAAPAPVAAARTPEPAPRASAPSTPTAPRASAPSTPTRPEPTPSPAPSQSREAEATPEPEPVAQVAAPGLGTVERAGRFAETETEAAPSGEERPDQMGSEAQAETSEATEEVAAVGTPAAEREKGPAARTPQEKPPAPEPATSGWIDRLGAGDPTVGLSIALGGVAFLLLAFLALRRRSQRIAREAASAPWPPPGAAPRPEFAPAEAAAEPDAAQEAPSASEGPLFAPTERDEGPGDEPVELPQAAVDAEPEVVAKEDASPRVEELERRIERLEARLSDSLDARERLDRQLAAHTEELRVQRAAIARTQRAVRAAVRGPEAAPTPAAAPTPGEAGGQGGGQGEG